MPLFRYRAMQPSGAIFEGEVEASDRVAAAARVQAGGSYPIAVEPAAAPGAGSAAARSGPALAQSELALMTRELATLTSAGLPLDRALGILATLGARPRIATLAAELKAGIEGGESLSALCLKRRAFPRLYGAMVAAGEAKGDLAGALERLAVLLERDRAVTQSLVSALIYPASVTVVALVSAAFLVAFVMPRLEAMLSDLHRDLPPTTRLVLALASGAEQILPFAIIVGAAAAIYLAWRLREPEFRRRFDQRLLRLPIVGALLLKIEAERFARLFGGLLAADVELLHALATAREAATNRGFAGMLSVAETQIARGDGVAAALAAAPAMPTVLVELTRVGVETGRLPDMLVKAGDVLKQEIEVATTRFLGLITPVSTILLGLLVGGLVLAIFNAILDVYDFAP
jgi:general secretion pathway protein F